MRIAPFVFDLLLGIMLLFKVGIPVAIVVLLYKIYRQTKTRSVEFQRLLDQAPDDETNR